MVGPRLFGIKIDRPVAVLESPHVVVQLALRNPTAVVGFRIFRVEVTSGLKLAPRKPVVLSITERGTSSLMYICTSRIRYGTPDTFHQQFRQPVSIVDDVCLHCLKLCVVNVIPCLKPDKIHAGDGKPLPIP